MKILNIPTVITIITVTLFFVPALSTRYQGFSNTAFAEEVWKQEFMAVCSKTDEAMSLSNDELKILLQRGEKLRPVIESQEETTRKVFLKRLQKCMNLYSFVLDAKGADKKP